MATNLIRKIKSPKLSFFKCKIYDEASVRVKGYDEASVRVKVYDEASVRVKVYDEASQFYFLKIIFFTMFQW